MKKIWTCKIGEADEDTLPFGADWPMRRAIEKAYEQITGKKPHYIFSGWGGKLDEFEREVIEQEGWTGEEAS